MQRFVKKDFPIHFQFARCHHPEAQIQKHHFPSCLTMAHSRLGTLVFLAPIFGSVRAITCAMVLFTTLEALALFHELLP